MRNVSKMEEMPSNQPCLVLVYICVLAQNTSG